MRRIHSDSDGEGEVVLAQWNEELLFSISSWSWFLSSHPGVLGASPT
jgi:hypothetical protein